MVITLDGAPAEFLEEFAKIQNVSVEEALMQLLLQYARVFLHGKQSGIQETGAGVTAVLDRLAKAEG